MDEVLITIYRMQVPVPGTVTGAPRRSRSGTILAGFAFILAAAALVISVLTWLQTRGVDYSAEEQAAAQATACDAYATVRTGVATNTNLSAPGGGADVAGSLAVAANARVALIGGGQYLLARLDPATPPELADSLREFGTKLMDFGAAATAGAVETDPAQEALLREIDTLNVALAQQCG